VADPAAFQDTYGTLRRLSIPGLLTGDLGGAKTAASFAEDMATGLLARYDSPAFRIAEFSVELAALDSTDQATVLGIDIAEPVDVEFTPNGVGDPISQTLVVQGIAHEITPESHVVTFSVIDYMEPA
jgi:hypothetical protein